jgi:hypothetical protein
MKGSAAMWLLWPIAIVNQMWLYDAYYSQNCALTNSVLDGALNSVIGRLNTADDFAQLHVNHIEEKEGLVYSSQ